ncbi:MAG: hypothetical protein NVS2B3_06270 [Vulcanimicrobiaceae bacterium]
MSAPPPIDVGAAIARWDKLKADFIKTLDLHLLDVSHGEASMRMPFRAQILNGAGAVHGGAIVSLCDTVFWVALSSIYGPSQPTATAALSCAFLRPALPPHDLVAHARVRKPGKRIVYGDVEVFSGEKLVAHATFSFLNTPFDEARDWNSVPAALDVIPTREDDAPPAPM